MVRTASLIAALIALLSLSAHAQVNKPVYQGPNPVTRGHIASWLDQGVVGDGGGQNNGNINALGIVAPGLPSCINDVPISSLSGYHQLCFGALATLLGDTGAFITYNAYAGATPDGLFVNLNGINYPFPGAGNGNVVGPVSPSPINCHAVVWNGGTAVRDGGSSPLFASCFGVKADGVTDDSAAMQTAFNTACASGGTLIIPAGHIILNSGVSVTGCHDLNVSAFGANIDMTGGGAFQTAFLFLGTIGSPVPISADIGTDATTISLTSGGGASFSAGQLVQVSSTFVFDSQVQSYLGALTEISSVSGDNLIMYNPLHVSQQFKTSDSAAVTPITPTHDIHWEGGTFTGINDVNAGQQGIEVDWGRDISIRHITTHHIESIPIYFFNVYKFHADENDLEDMQNVNSGYGFSAGNATSEGTVFANVFRNCGVCIIHTEDKALNGVGQARDIIISHNIANGDNPLWFGGHSSYEYLTSVHNKIIGNAPFGTNVAFNLNGGDFTSIGDEVFAPHGQAFQVVPATTFPANVTIDSSDVDGGLPSHMGECILVFSSSASSKIGRLVLHGNKCKHYTNIGIQVNWINPTTKIGSCYANDNDIDGSNVPAQQAGIGFACLGNSIPVAAPWTVYDAGTNPTGQIPACDQTLDGKTAYFYGATAPTYAGVLTTGGATHVIIECTGFGWTTH